MGYQFLFVRYGVIRYMVNYYRIDIRIVFVMVNLITYSLYMNRNKKYRENVNIFV